MEKLSNAKRAAVLRCLVEGTSIATATRLTGTCKPAILKTLEQAGEACSNFMDEKMVNLPSTELQLDEVWSFVGCKEKQKDSCIQKHPGSVWTWTAYCPTTKMIPTWRVGDRDMSSADDFCYDLAQRCPNVAQITSDGLSHYQQAIARYFPRVAFAQLVKTYRKDEEGNDSLDISKRTIQGNPDARKISTSLVERSNLTIRMGNRRFTRKTNGYSKKLENHCHTLAIQMVHYNFARPHMSLKKGTPAMRAGLADKVMSVEALVEMTDGYWQRREAEAFEAEFQAKYTRGRTTPKTWAPREPLTPWYLDPESGGPNPLPAYRRPGIKYQD